VHQRLLRLATSTYFLLLWNGSAVVLWLRGDAILTPELLATIAWMGWVQLAVAIPVISRRTCILAAVGICILYIAGIVQYGIFHMADYVFFPGIAAYLALTTAGTPRALRLASRRWLAASPSASCGPRSRSSSIRNGRPRSC